jgi:hypothetical protein
MADLVPFFMGIGVGSGGTARNDKDDREKENRGE